MFKHYFSGGENWNIFVLDGCVSATECLDFVSKKNHSGFLQNA